MWAYGNVPTGWKICKVKDYSTVVTDYVANGSFASLAKNVNYKDTEDEAVLIRLTDFNNGFNGNFVYIDNHAYEFLSKSKLFGGEIIISNVGANVGTVFKCPYLDKKMSLAPNSIMLKTLGNDDFYYYWFSSRNGQHSLKSIVTGSAQPKFNKTNFRDLEIPVPPIETQNRIVSILKSIDSKIELNNKINNNLQQQAFALFDKLLSGEHLEVCALSEIAELNPKRSLAKNEMARCIDMAQLSASGSFPNGWQIKPYNGGMRFANGDTLLARITPCLENGKTAYIDFLDTDEIAFGSSEYVVLCSKGQYPSEFFYCLARYPSFVDYAVKNMNGSSGRQRVSAETIGKYLLPRLTDDELAEFRDVVPALFSAIRLNSLENIRLSELRDAFLPKLMSGEIDVSDIDI